MKANLKDAKKFIQSLKDQLNKSREKRKDLVDKIKEKQSQSIDDQVLKEKTEECEKQFARVNAVQKNTIESIMMKLTKEVEEMKNNEENLSQLLKDKFDECCRLDCENDQLKLDL